MKTCPNFQNPPSAGAAGPLAQSGSGLPFENQLVGNKISYASSM